MVEKCRQFVHYSYTTPIHIFLYFLIIARITFYFNFSISLFNQSNSLCVYTFSVISEIL